MTAIGAEKSIPRKTKKMRNNGKDEENNKDGEISTTITHNYLFAMNEHVQCIMYSVYVQYVQNVLANIINYFFYKMRLFSLQMWKEDYIPGTTFNYSTFDISYNLSDFL